MNLKLIPDWFQSDLKAALVASFTEIFMLCENGDQEDIRQLLQMNILDLVGQLLMVVRDSLSARFLVSQILSQSGILCKYETKHDCAVADKKQETKLHICTCSIVQNIFRNICFFNYEIE